MKDFAELVYRYSTRQKKKIKKICEPLEQLGITSFWHETMSEEGYFSCILSEGELGEYFAENKLYKGHPGFRHPDLMQRAVDFPDLLYGIDEKYDSTQGMIKTKFQSDQILHLRERQGKEVHLYGFSSKPAKLGMKQVYLNYTALLWKFIRYFKAQAGELIAKVYDQKIHIAPHCGDDFYRELITEKDQLKLNKIHRFLAMVGEDTFFPDFTPRELDCIRYYLRGLSARQIGLELGLSKRTVEHHLENIKLKLFCNNRAELIEHLQLFKECQLL